MNPKNRNVEAHLRIDEASELLQLSPARVRQLLRNGKLGGVRPRGQGNWRVPLSAIRDYLSAGETAAIST